MVRQERTCCASQKPTQPMPHPRLTHVRRRQLAHQLRQLAAEPNRLILTQRRPRRVAPPRRRRAALAVPPLPPPLPPCWAAAAAAAAPPLPVSIPPAVVLTCATLQLAQQGGGLG